MTHDGRLFARSMPAVMAARDGGRAELRAPTVGFWRSAPDMGAFLGPGAMLGEIEALGALVRIEVPAGAAGIVVEVLGDGSRARQAVAWGDALVVLDPSGAPSAMTGAASGAEAAHAFSGLALRAPSSGRFYARPSPGEPPFVKPGDVVTAGQTVALLEVMKTFNRIAYGGAGLPDRARVTRVVPPDESDVLEHDVLLELEASP